MKKVLLLSIVVYLINCSAAFAQCGSMCGSQMLSCQFLPPEEGACNGYASWNVELSIHPYTTGAIYNSQGVFVQWSSLNYGGAPYYSGGAALPPGDYTLNFTTPGGTPCPQGSVFSFTIPGPDLEGSISVSIDSQETEYPVNRCSMGSVTVSYSINEPNCLPQPTATLTHDGGTINGVFQSPNQFFFDNVPNSNPITIDLTAGPATGSTTAAFLGECTGGTGGASEATPASAGCADGIIAGSLPTAGACGPSGLLIKSLPDMTPVTNYTINAEGTGFTVTVPPGEYEVTGSTDNGSAYPCYVSPYTVTVGESEGELPFTGNVQVIDAQGLCENGKLLISGNSSHPCYAGGFDFEVKIPATEEVVASGGAVGEYLVQGLSGMTQYSVTVTGHFQSGTNSESQNLGTFLVGVGDPAPETCNGIDDDCDGDIDEDSSDPNTYYVDADGDGFGDPNQPVQACSAPPGTSAVAGDCDDGNNGVGNFSVPNGEPCEVTLNVTLNSIDNEGYLCMGAHYTVEIESNACFSYWSLEIPDLAALDESWQFSAGNGEAIEVVMPLVTQSNVGADFIGYVGSISDNCGTNVQIHDNVTPLACQYNIDQLTIIPQTENEPNGGIILDYSFPSCPVGTSEETVVGIGFKSQETGQLLFNGFNVEESTEFHVEHLPAGTYVVDFYYSWGYCLAQNATTVTIPYTVAPIVADFNGDGTVNQADSDLLHSHYGCIVAQNSDCSMFDLDGDGVIGYGDGLLFIGEFAGN